LAASDFSGASALEFTRKAVAFGQRPAGSEANRKLQALIKSSLKTNGWEISEDSFTAPTPVGAKSMTNIMALKKGGSGKAVVFTGHFDTKAIPGVNFVGANDGGASAGVLLELARVLAKAPRKDDVYLVFFDGEEAFGEWSDTNGVYGSRHLAQKWSIDGTLSHIKALINVDMIGDKNLGIMDEGNSSASLRRLVWSVGSDLGYGKNFLTSPSAIEDDHMPFVRMGVNALDLIDFDYGPGHRYWHTAEDTVDKLSGNSLQVVGDVLLETLRRLEN
jgi:glutaminyl-peptide cyclotransferase